MCNFVQTRQRQRSSLLPAATASRRSANFHYQSTAWADDREHRARSNPTGSNRVKDASMTFGGRVRRDRGSWRGIAAPIILLSSSTSLALSIAACGFPRPADVVPGTPGDFSECRGGAELTCNNVGTGYDTVQCARGCDPNIGCRLCDANQTVCINGKVQTCDATGAVASSEVCPLGCFQDQPRCREIDPSNGLASAMEMAAAGPDLILENATLSVPNAMLIDSTGGTRKLQSLMITAPQDGVPIQVFPVRSLLIVGNNRIVSDGTGAPAVAFMVRGDVKLNGAIALASSGSPPPGAVDAGACVGQEGLVDVAGVGYILGGGGGGAATRGGDGGAQAHPARQGGAAFPNPDLQPLRGGCTGGTPAWFSPGYGGGAVQITSRSSIRLGVNSEIRANGLVGYAGGMPQGTPGPESEPGGGG